MTNLKRLPLLLVFFLLLGGCATQPTAQTPQVDFTQLIGMDIHDVFNKYGVDKGEYTWNFYDILSRQVMGDRSFGASDFTSAVVRLSPKSGLFQHKSGSTFFLRVKNDKVTAAGLTVEAIMPPSKN
jgi:hypothetical protein